MFVVLVVFARQTILPIPQDNKSFYAATCTQTPHHQCVCAVAHRTAPGVNTHSRPNKFVEE